MNHFILPVSESNVNCLLLQIVGWRDGLVVSALVQRLRGRRLGSSPLAAGCRITTVGQLLFAHWVWAYSTLHPLGVGK